MQPSTRSLCCDPSGRLTAYLLTKSSCFLTLLCTLIARASCDHDFVIRSTSLSLTEGQIGTSRVCLNMATPTRLVNFDTLGS